MSAARVPRRGPGSLPMSGAGGRASSPARVASAEGPAPSPVEALTAPVLLRGARATDVPAIAALVAEYARWGLLLPRPADAIARDIDTFVVAVDAHGLIGCGALRVDTPTLAELCSLAVAESYHGRGVGGMIVESIVERAQALGIPQLFALTLRERFFNRLGFRTGLIADVPEKVWADCAGCALRAACREIMVVRDLGSAR